ncbi:MAG: hypothetical protein ACRDJH_20415 [Thermomicrobiales bacterium]
MHQTHIEGLMTGEDLDDEEPTADETAESEAAWQAYVAGDDPGASIEEVRRGLLET